MQLNWLPPGVSGYAAVPSIQLYAN